MGVAKANFYPQFSLTALFGQVSPELSSFILRRGQRVERGGKSGRPIFQGGLLKGKLHQARAAWEEAALQYQSVVLNAFQEVSNALTARKQLARERVEQALAVRAYEEAVQVANERYTAGQANYYES